MRGDAGGHAPEDLSARESSGPFLPSRIGEREGPERRFAMSARLEPRTR